jgi:hypothetical protein
VANFSNIRINFDDEQSATTSKAQLVTFTNVRGAQPSCFEIWRTKLSPAISRRSISPQDLAAELAISLGIKPQSWPLGAHSGHSVTTILPAQGGTDLFQDRFISQMYADLKAGK